MVGSLLKLAGLNWPVPDFSTLFRRQKTLAVQIPYRRADGPLNLLVASTGIKFLGDGEWHARKHGVQGRRQWRKVHLPMDTATSDIHAVEFTPSRDGDSPVLPHLLEQIPEDEEIGTVTADGAYDTCRCRSAILARDAVPGYFRNRWPDDPGIRTRSFRSARMVDCGRKTARRRASATKPCAPPNTMAGPSGSAGQAITPEVGSKRRFAA
jgi:hypothetical protein